MILRFFSITFFLSIFNLSSQTDSAKKYNPHEEIDYDGKRYRVYNNWLSVGPGAGYNSHWPKDERNLGVDFSFHIKKSYFRVGAFSSGARLRAANTNNYNFHIQYGLRKEDIKYNVSAFLGPSLSYFKRPLSDSTQFGLNNVLDNVYNEFGFHACIEVVYKIKYDVGIGGQVFCDYNRVQFVYGVRLIAYLSSAFRGAKYGRKTPRK